MSDPAAEVRPLIRSIYALGMTATVVLTLGLAEFLYFEPLGQTTGTEARVQGIYAYDAKSGQVTGEDSSRFDRSQPFAAVVEWDSVPDDMFVTARWYNGLGIQVGGTPISQAGLLVGSPPIRVETSRGLKSNLPGEYLFVVERVSRGQPVEVLARRLILVTQG
jgi:hypothetical protein